GVGDGQVRRTGGHGRHMQAARTMAPFTPNGVVSRLGAGPLPRRAGGGGVTGQALVGVIGRLERLAQEVLDPPRLRSLKLGPVPSRPFGRAMIRESQDAE